MISGRNGISRHFDANGRWHKSQDKPRQSVTFSNAIGNDGSQTIL
jgi:hypothetical protein